MKLNSIIVVIVVVLGVVVGLNFNKMHFTNTSNDSSAVNASTETAKGEVSKEEKQKRFVVFYNNMYQLIDSFKKADSLVVKLSESNPSKIQAYDNFKNLRDLMEEGQKLPLNVPDGFNKTQEETLTKVTDEISNTFQYRKFAYENFLDYLDTNSLKKEDKAKEWLNSAKSSLQSAIINLEAMKAELGIKDISKNK